MVVNYNYNSYIQSYIYIYIQNYSLLVDVNGGKANGERDHPQVASFLGCSFIPIYGIGFPTVSTLSAMIPNDHFLQGVETTNRQNVVGTKDPTISYAPFTEY